MTRWVLKAQRGDFEMRNIDRGRVFSHWVKKTSNFLSPERLKKDFLSGFSQISTFERSEFAWVLRNLRFLPWAEIFIVLDSIFRQGY